MRPETPTNGNSRSTTVLYFSPPCSYAERAVPSRERPSCAAIRQRVSRLAGLVLLGATLLFATGCGNAFDGGTIPNGRSVRLFGQVVNAANPQQPLTKATVSVTSTPAGGTPQTAQTSTDSNGAFNFPSVNSGATSATVQMTITPSNADFKAQKVTFLLSSGYNADLLVTLPPASFPDTGAALQISPPFVSAQTGQPVNYTAQLLDASGKPLRILPTLLYSGNSGTISTTGVASDGSNATFYPIAQGPGTISALWYDKPAAIAQVIVSKSATSAQPPTPPPPTTITGK